MIKRIRRESSFLITSQNNDDQQTPLLVDTFFELPPEKRIKMTYKPRAPASIRAFQESSATSKRKSCLKRKHYCTSKVVQFQPSLSSATNRVEENIITATSLDHFDTISEWTSTLWYNKNELKQFRTTAVNISKQIIAIRAVAIPVSDDSSVESTSDSSSSIANNVEPSLAYDSYTRGLESRWCKERKRRKYIATKFILKAASIIKREQLQEQEKEIKVFNNDETMEWTAEQKLASIAIRCNAYAAKLALAEGYNDYKRARMNYDDDDLEACFWDAMA